MSACITVRQVAREVVAERREIYVPEDFSDRLRHYGMKFFWTTWCICRGFLDAAGYEARPLDRRRAAYVRADIPAAKFLSMRAEFLERSSPLESLFDQPASAKPEKPRQKSTAEIAAERLHEALKKITAKAEPALPMEPAFWDWKKTDLPF